MNTETIKNIKIFSHYACPSCYIAKGVMKKLKEEINFDLEIYPLEVAKNVPKNGLLLDIFFQQQNKDVDERYNYVKALGAEYGLVINKPTFKCNTYLALVLGEYARANNKYEEYSERVFKAHYEEDKNISEESELVNILKEIGLEAENISDIIKNGQYENKVEEYLELVKKYDVLKTPTFIINDDLKIQGEENFIDLVWGQKDSSTSVAFECELC